MNEGTMTDGMLSMEVASGGNAYSFTYHTTTSDPGLVEGEIALTDLHKLTPIADFYGESSDCGMRFYHDGNNHFFYIVLDENHEISSFRDTVVLRSLEYEHNSKDLSFTIPDDASITFANEGATFSLTLNNDIRILFSALHQDWSDAVFHEFLGNSADSEESVAELSQDADEQVETAAPAVIATETVTEAPIVPAPTPKNSFLGWAICASVIALAALAGCGILMKKLKSRNKIVVPPSDPQPPAADTQALEKQLADARKRIRELQDQASGAADAQGQERQKIDDLTRRSHDLLRQNERYAAQIQELESAVSQYENTVHELSAAKKTSEELRRENARLQELLAKGSSGTAQNNDLSAELDRIRQDLARSVEEQRETEARLREAQEQAAALTAENAALKQQLSASQAPNTPPDPEEGQKTTGEADDTSEITDTERRRISVVLDEYLDTLSDSAEQELAARFRETVKALMVCSTDDVVLVMSSPVIGTEPNKRTLRAHAQRSGRPDIIEKLN